MRFYSEASMLAEKTRSSWLIWRKIWLGWVLKIQFPTSTAAIFSLIARSRRRGFGRFWQLISVGLMIFLSLLSLSALPCFKKIANLPTWCHDETAFRRDVLFYLPETDRESVQKMAGSWANDKEKLHFGQTAFFYSNADQADYLKSNYHTKLLKSSFYKQLTIRNGKTFQKIMELVN